MNALILCCWMCCVGAAEFEPKIPCTLSSYQQEMVGVSDGAGIFVDNDAVDGQGFARIAAAWTLTKLRRAAASNARPAASSFR